MLEGQTYDAMPQRSPHGVPAQAIRLDMIDEVRKWEAGIELPVGTAINGERQPLLF